MGSVDTKNKRTGLIRLVHVGKGKMGMTDDAYRAFLDGTVGKNSCADMTVGELEIVLRTMRKNGFPTAPGRVRPQEKGTASTAQLEYIKGMWAKCARNKSGEALLKFVSRIAHVKALRFLTPYSAQDVILALREMMGAAGFDPDTSERTGTTGSAGRPAGTLAEEALGAAEK